MRRCIYHSDLGKMHYFTIFQDKLHSVNIQDDQSWAFSKTVPNISKITYTATCQIWTNQSINLDVKRDQRVTMVRKGLHRLYC